MRYSHHHYNHFDAAKDNYTQVWVELMILGVEHKVIESFLDSNRTIQEKELITYGMALVPTSLQALSYLSNIKNAATSMARQVVNENSERRLKLALASKAAGFIPRAIKINGSG